MENSEDHQSHPPTPNKLENMTGPMDVESNKLQGLEAKIHAQLHEGYNFKYELTQKDDSDFGDYNKILKDLKNRAIKQGKNLSLLLTNLMFLVSSKGDDSTMEKLQVLENSLKRVSQGEDYEAVFSKFIELFQAAGTIMSKKRKENEIINHKKVFEEDEIDEPILEFVKEIFRLHLLWAHRQITCKMAVKNITSPLPATLKDAIPSLRTNVEKCEEALKLLKIQVKSLEEKLDSDDEYKATKESGEYKQMVSKINEMWDQM